MIFKTPLRIPGVLMPGQNILRVGLDTLAADAA